jgi:DNA-binding IclR family transcriptional regulator
MAAALPERALRQMLSQREAARHCGDVQQAERLLDQLRVHGVWLDDSAQQVRQGGTLRAVWRACQLGGAFFCQLGGGAVAS